MSNRKAVVVLPSLYRLTAAKIATVSSALIVLIICSFVPARTRQESTAMTRNINVKTWISGPLSVSVMIFCVEVMMAMSWACPHSLKASKDSQERVKVGSDV